MSEITAAFPRLSGFGVVGAVVGALALLAATRSEPARVETVGSGVRAASASAMEEAATRPVVDVRQTMRPCDALVTTMVFIPCGEPARPPHRKAARAR